uniref:Uncharacterized protein n=1 Tax=Siphoviridae sp. ctGpg14 TaxID=2827824 RepID=A0A8S5T741_9CAUD|nr:MAG TPA: hypothetical protein [Siphoviridae sp. ctGpg14]
MIESLVYMLLAIGNSLFDAFVFMFGWNTVVHKIGFPEISYILSYGICLFIGYVKNNDINDKEGEDRKEYIRKKVALGIANNVVYIVLFLVYRWIVG